MANRQVAENFLGALQRNGVQGVSISAIEILLEHEMCSIEDLARFPEIMTIPNLLNLGIKAKSAAILAAHFGMKTLPKAPKSESGKVIEGETPSFKNQYGLDPYVLKKLWELIVHTDFLPGHRTHCLIWGRTAALLLFEKDGKRHLYVDGAAYAFTLRQESMVDDLVRGVEVARKRSEYLSNISASYVLQQIYDSLTQSLKNLEPKPISGLPKPYQLRAILQNYRLDELWDLLVLLRRNPQLIEIVKPEELLLLTQSVEEAANKIVDTAVANNWYESLVAQAMVERHNLFVWPVRKKTYFG